MNEYISVQEAIEKINERARETFTLAPGYEYYLGALHDVADDLRQMPTIDAVPVKHGKWVEHGEPNSSGEYEKWFDKCSVCGEVGLCEYRYCPNCGAQMDGEKDATN